MNGETEARLLALARACAQVFLEVEAGRRSPHNLAPLLASRVAARVGDWWLDADSPRQVGRGHGVMVNPHTFEAAVMARGRHRAGAIALRMERRDDGWRVTELGRPEDGPIPEPPAYLPVFEPCAFALCLEHASGEEGGALEEADWDLADRPLLAAGLQVA